MLLQNWKEDMKTLEKIFLPMNHGRTVENYACIVNDFVKWKEDFDKF